MDRKITFSLLILIITNSISMSQNFGNWTLTDSLKDIRINSASIDLADGNILVSGGADENILKSSEIYDYKTNKWRLTDSMNVPRYNHCLIRLNNGNILAVAGNSATCEIFDPIKEEWSLTDSLNYKVNGGNTVTLLNDGNVLEVGGSCFIGKKNFSPQICEIYDVETGKWHDTDSIQIDIYEHSATKLLDGRVLIVGGFSKSKKSEVNNCELYDPSAGKWTDAAPLNIGRQGHTATLLKDGRVLVCGGNNQSELHPNSCELYDPINNTWTMVGSTFYFRYYHTAVLLDNGFLFIAGAGIKPWELYDVNNFKQYYHGDYPGDSGEVPGTLINKLPNGEVLVAGGAVPYLAYWKITKTCYLYIPTVTGIVEKQNLIDSYNLYQNYPNPFNPATTIMYELPKQDFVILKIFDSVGREISTLINCYQSAGVYSINFDGSQFPSGVYFYTLFIKGFNKTKKMILIK